MISVVVASCRSGVQLADTLASLAEQCRAMDAELIVARSGSAYGAPLGAVVAHRIVNCPAGATIPEIRGAGLHAASGDWVAMTEDNCVATPDWLRTLAGGFSPDVQIVGGAMGNARRERAIDAGAAFAEYGFFGPGGRPARASSPPLVTGANVAYHRSVMADVAQWASGGDWEDVIHHRLGRAGARFAVVPAARIDQNLEYSLAAFCQDRFEHGRDYARVRSSGMSFLRRLAFALPTPALPFVLGARIWRSSGRYDVGPFVRSLPWTLTFLGAWAVGEFIGYLTPGSGP